MELAIYVDKIVRGVLMSTSGRARKEHRIEKVRFYALSTLIASLSFDLRALSSKVWTLIATLRFDINVFDINYPTLL